MLAIQIPVGLPYLKRGRLVKKILRFYLTALIFSSSSLFLKKCVKKLYMGCSSQRNIQCKMAWTAACSYASIFLKGTAGKTEIKLANYE